MNNNEDLPDDSTPGWGALERVSGAVGRGGYARFLATLSDEELLQRLDQAVASVRSERGWLTPGGLPLPLFAHLSDDDLLQRLAALREQVRGRPTSERGAVLGEQGSGLGPDAPV